MPRVTYEEAVRSRSAPSGIEDIPTYCHLFPTNRMMDAGVSPDWSFCGINRSEQPFHGARHGKDKYCPICGELICPKCRKIYYG